MPTVVELGLGRLRHRARREHQPGNSGGRCSTPSRRVVAVNYASGDPGTGTNQFFAIAADQAEPIVEQLREGVDVHSLGINGQAVIDETDGIAGVWSRPSPLAARPASLADRR